MTCRFYLSARTVLTPTVRWATGEGEAVNLGLNA
jgi:hypothetical protein